MIGSIDLGRLLSDRHAAELYAANPVALQLRQMNLLSEMNKERGTTVLIPTDMASAMGRMFAAATNSEPT